MFIENQKELTDKEKRERNVIIEKKKKKNYLLLDKGKQGIF